MKKIITFCLGAVFVLCSGYYIANNYNNAFVMSLPPDFLVDGSMSEVGYSRWIKASGPNAGKVWDETNKVLSATTDWANSEVAMQNTISLIGSPRLVVPSHANFIKEDGIWLVGRYVKSGGSASPSDIDDTFGNRWAYYMVQKGRVVGCWRF